MEVDEEIKEYDFVDMTKGGVIPKEFVPSCDKGFRNAMKKGPQLEAPIVGVRCVINDGQWHPVDSSDMAFQTAALYGFKEAFEKAKPAIQNTTPSGLFRCARRLKPSSKERLRKD